MQRLAWGVDFHGGLDCIQAYASLTPSGLSYVTADAIHDIKEKLPMPSHAQLLKSATPLKFGQRSDAGPIVIINDVSWT